MTGNRIMDMALAVLSLGATFIVLVTIIYSEYIYKSPLPDNMVEEARLREEGLSMSYPDTYKLDALVVNLRSHTNRLRFLDVQIYLVSAIKGADQIYPNFKPQIYDAIIEIAGRMLPDEINSIHGKVIFEDRVKKSINEIIGRPITRSLQFTKFVVQ